MTVHYARVAPAETESVIDDAWVLVTIVAVSVTIIDAFDGQDGLELDCSTLAHSLSLN